MEPDGWLMTKTLIDYEANKEFSMCVAVISVATDSKSGRKKRSIDTSLVDLTLDNVIYISVAVEDANDNGPKFQSDSIVAGEYSEIKISTHVCHPHNHHCCQVCHHYHLGKALENWTLFSSIICCIH